MQQIPQPPSGITGVIRDYLEVIRKAINNQPTWSYASLSNPNSTVVGKLGDKFFNTGSASTMSREWTKMGPDNGTSYSSVSWVLTRIIV